WPRGLSTNVASPTARPNRATAASPMPAATPHSVRALRCAARSRTSVAWAEVASAAAAWVTAATSGPPPGAELLPGCRGPDPRDRGDQGGGGHEHDDEGLDHDDDVDRDARAGLH